MCSDAAVEWQKELTKRILWLRLGNVRPPRDEQQTGCYLFYDYFEHEDGTCKYYRT